MWIFAFVFTMPLWACQCHHTETLTIAQKQEASPTRIEVINGYTVKTEEIEIDGNKNYRTTILQNAKELFSDTSPHMCWFPDKIGDLGRSYPTPLDLSGDKSFQHVIMITHSGVAHCCYKYHIFKLGENFEHEKLSHHGNGGVDFRSVLGGPYMGYGHDETFLYYKNFSYANSVAPDIVLTFKEGHFVLDQQAMKRVLSEEDCQEQLTNILKLIDTKVAEKEERHLDHRLLQWVLELIYSGNARFAWKAFESIQQKYPLFLSGNTEEKKVADWNSEKQDLVNKMKESPYYQDILEINGGTLSG